MEIIDNIINYKEEYFYNLNKEDVCFFDIETTGLHRTRDIIYLIGILYFDSREKKWVLRQYFAPDLKDEVEVLIGAVDFLSKFNTIVNYNGNSFDLPFVNYRLNLLDINREIPPEKSLDIYAILRKNKDFLDLPNLKLTSVEKYLSIYREDIYTGRDCIQFYRDFVLSRDLELKKKILKHNYDDLYYLPPVMEILQILKDKKTIHTEKENLSLTLLIDSIKIEKDFLLVMTQVEKGLDYNIHYYGDNYKIFINDLGLLEFNFEIKQGLISPSEKSFFLINSNFPISSLQANNYGYKITHGITIVTIGSKYLTDNIKSFISSILKNIL